MSVTYKITREFDRANEKLTSSIEKTGGAEAVVSESIPDESTDLLVSPVAIDVSQLKAIYIKATGGALTVKTNSSSVPDDTLALIADKAIDWTDDDPVGMRPLGTDVTKLYVTNASGAAVTLELRALQDPTA